MRLKLRQGLCCLLLQVLGVVSGGTQAQQGRVGGFVGGQIGTLLLAQGGGFALDIQYVIHYLKGQPQVLAVLVDSGQFVVGGIGGVGTKQQRGPNKCAGFV